MTTIAYRDGHLAADTKLSHRGGLVGHSSKIDLVAGLLVGAVGDSAWCWAFRSWVRCGAKRNHPRPRMDSGGFIVMPDGVSIHFHSTGMEYRRPEEFFADGSGQEYALGAMSMGATAAEAVFAAARWDAATGGEVTVLCRG